MPLTASKSPKVLRRTRAPMATSSSPASWGRRSGNGGTCASPCSERRIATNVFSSADAAQRVAERLADRALPGARVAHQDVEPIAEALHVGDAVPAAERRLRPAQVRR